MSLSPRLQFAFDHLIPQQDIWDLCCDHGYLGGAAYKSQNFKNIYFVDPVITIMQNLQSRFEEYVFNPTYSSKAYFLQQNAQSIKQPLYGTICILGVGGHLVYEIVNTLAKHDQLHAQRLILSPHRDAELLLRDTFLKKYKLITQKKIIENQRERDFFIFDSPSTVF